MSDAPIIIPFDVRRNIIPQYLQLQDINNRYILLEQAQFRSQEAFQLAWSNDDPSLLINVNEQILVNHFGSRFKQCYHLDTRINPSSEEALFFRAFANKKFNIASCLTNLPEFIKQEPIFLGCYFYNSLMDLILGNPHKYKDTLKYLVMNREIFGKYRTTQYYIEYHLSLLPLYSDDLYCWQCYASKIQSAVISWMYSNYPENKDVLFVLVETLDNKIYRKPPKLVAYLNKNPWIVNGWKQTQR